MNTKKILLMIPPENQKLVMERDKKVTDAFGEYTPLGIMYIATFLKKKFGDKIEVKVIDCAIGEWPYEKLEKLILEMKPAIIGMTVLTPQILDVKVVLEKVKRLLPECTTVIGGPHVTSFQEDALGFKEIDYGIMGYGEYSFFQLVNAVFFDGKFEDVNGLLYRKNGEIIKNPMNDGAIPLDDLPIVDRELVPYKQYRCPVGTKDVMATVVSSRGCPFRCTFCNSPDKIYRERSMENVIEEVKYLDKLGIKEVFFFDDLFNLKNDRVYKFCRLLRENNLKVTWSFRGRVTNIDDDIMKELKKSNCERIHFGIETHTNESLKRLNKGITVEQIRNATSLCHKYKINAAGSFMINLPGDTRQDILDRFKFANSLKLDYCQFAILMAYNHTAIFAQGVKEGQWPEDLWLNFIKNPTKDFVVPMWDNGIPRKELDELLRYGLKKFYFRPSFIAKRIMNIHSFDEIKKYFFGALKLTRF